MKRSLRFIYQVYREYSCFDYDGKFNDNRIRYYEIQTANEKLAKEVYIFQLLGIAPGETATA
jgi:hypothetical protein